MLRLLKWVGLAALFLVFAALIFIALIWFRANQAIPRQSGSFEVVGLQDEVHIVRDEHGVPHIFGDSELDALFGLGFAHAQDRLWQMDFMRRAGRGTISEILGGDALPIDRFMRTFDFAGKSQSDLEYYSTEDRARIAAYTAGVNAWMNEKAFKKPAEYVLTFSEPESWEDVDTLILSKLLWQDLSQNITQELARARIANLRGAKLAGEFYPPYPKDGHVAMDWKELAASLGLPDLVEEPPEGVEVSVDGPSTADHSNNWVIAGDRSVSGAPILANDPHLGFTMPGFWYFAHIKLPTGSVVGATIPGMPAVVLGRNEYLSWGSTNSQDTDVIDLYLEPKLQGDASSYLTPEGSEKFESRTEVFRPRFSEPIEVEYKRSRHGPILSPDLVTQSAFDSGAYELSVAWPVLQEPDMTLSAIMQVNRARTMDDVLLALKDFTGPPQNIVFAHKDGEIALAVAGLTPIRGEDHQTRGLSPARGDDARNEWNGYIPFEMTPVIVNPTSGAFVTANARVTPPEYPYFRSAESTDPSRQQRIQNLLDARAQHSAESFADIQLDLTNMHSNVLLPILLAHPAEGPLAEEAVVELRSWNGAWSGDSAAPLIYATWLDELTRRLTQDELGTLFRRYDGISELRLIDILSGGRSHWCDDIGTEEAEETCDQMIRESMAAALDRLAETHGDIVDWRWGNVFRNRHRHLGFDAIPVLGGVFSRVVPREAGPGAPNVGILDSGSLPQSAGVSHGPSMRMIVDMATPDDALFANSTGQSGHFASPHYDDLQEIWARGGYFKIPAEKPEGRDTNTLVLKPSE